MSFISYSQNFEDVLLWRALGHVPNGFYIDVGANDPELHSVTKAFYDAGWHGVNVEPMPSYRQPFLDQRPRDINLGCAAGAEEGEITLFDVPSMNGWASTDSSVAVGHRAEGYAVTETKVPMRTLAGICAEHAQGDIHFLKIDVEGFEGEVLKGMDLERWRPWLLVIEATLPGRRETNHETWEHLVTPHRYRYAYFDGLNRYYVAEEHAELMAALTVQPNVFDEYIPHHLDKAWKEGEQLALQVRSNWEQVEQTSARLEQEHQRLLALDAQCHAAQQVAEAAAEQALQLQVQLQAAEVRRQMELHAAETRLQLEMHAAEARARALQANLHQADKWGKGMEQQLLAVYASSSWRITAPLRLLARRGPDSLPNLARRKAKGALRRALRWLTSREALRRALLPVIARSPWLEQRVAHLLTAAKSATSGAAPHAPDVPQQLRDLPASARRVLADLQRAIEQHDKN